MGQNCYSVNIIHPIEENITKDCDIYQRKKHGHDSKNTNGKCTCIDMINEINNNKNISSMISMYKYIQKDCGYTKNCICICYFLPNLCQSNLHKCSCNLDTSQCKAQYHFCVCKQKHYVKKCLACMNKRIDGTKVILHCKCFQSEDCNEGIHFCQCNNLYSFVINRKCKIHDNFISLQQNAEDKQDEKDKEEKQDEKDKQNEQSHHQVTYIYDHILQSRGIEQLHDEFLMQPCDICYSNKGIIKPCDKHDHYLCKNCIQLIGKFYYKTNQSIFKFKCPFCRDVLVFLQ